MTCGTKILIKRQVLIACVQNTHLPMCTIGSICNYFHSRTKALAKHSLNLVTLIYLIPDWQKFLLLTGGTDKTTTSCQWGTYTFPGTCLSCLTAFYFFGNIASAEYIQVISHEPIFFYLENCALSKTVPSISKERKILHLKKINAYSLYVVYVKPHDSKILISIDIHMLHCSKDLALE